LNGLAQAISEVMFSGKPKFCLRKLVIDGVATIMSRAICDMLNSECVRLAIHPWAKTIKLSADF
jgi:hypothetical protein